MAWLPIAPDGRSACEIAIVALLTGDGRQLFADDDGRGDCRRRRGRLSELVLTMVVLADLVLWCCSPY